MISSIVSDDTCYKLCITHRRDNDYPSQEHIMYMDTFNEAIDYLQSVYHVFGIIDAILIVLYEK